jgi:adenylate cyclase class 2
VSVNLEVKALDPDPALTLAACVLLGATDAGQLSQRDTYFVSRTGRLKLRQDLAAGSAELIFYERADEGGARPSRYRRVPVVQPDELCELLAAALGIRGVVEKERRLFLFENVRVHLDDVAGLGTFVELEAVLASSDGAAKPEEQDALARVSAALRIDALEPVARSYVDLL